MNVSELLNSPVGQSIIKSVAGQLGMNENEASTAVSTAMPAIFAGMTKNVGSKEGAESLNKALESKHDGSLLDNLSAILQGDDGELQRDGDGILGHVFGANRSAIEKGVARKSGISLGNASSLLSTLAPIAMAYLGKEKRKANTGAGGLGDLLGGLLGVQQGQSSGSIMEMLGNALDKDGDGNPLNDILGGFLGGKKR